MIKTEMEDALFLKLRVGESCRIVHSETFDGKECSKGKDAAMVVTREMNGLKWYCHRCEEGGYTTMDGISPERTLKILNMIKKPSEMPEVRDFSIPDDSIHIYYDDGDWVMDADIPSYVFDWFEAYDIDGIDLGWAEQEVYWSPSYQRIIFAFYDEEDEVSHWVGRSLEPGAPKYMTRKRADMGRVFGTFIPFPSDTVVFTEDILSAIKVCVCSEASAVALLTTHIDYDVVRPYKDNRIMLWLDGDMHAKSIRQTKRLCNLGFNISSIRTDKDPKEYDSQEIMDYVYK